MLLNKRELWKLLLPAEGIITTVKIEVRLKIVMFLTALYFQPFSLSFLRFLSKYATFYAVNPTVTHLIL